MATVVPFRTKRKLVTAESALVDVLATKPAKLVILAEAEDGDLTLFSTNVNLAEMLWLMEQCRLAMLSGQVE